MLYPRKGTNMGMIGPVIGGIFGGMVGVFIWVEVGYFTHYEVGWIAWGVGFLVGFGVRSPPTWAEKKQAPPSVPSPPLPPSAAS